MTQATAKSHRSALRPEARAVERGKLDTRQKAAFDKIMELLGEAAAALDSREPKVKPTRPYLDAERSSRTALIYGRRGTGKTTLLLSLLKALVNPTDDFPVGRKVVLLDTLDMEPLAESTNLIAAVLARLEAAVGSLNEAPEQAGAWSRAGRVSGEEAVMMRLLDLQTRAASAFGGNLRDRAGGLDPGNFAAEVRRAERYQMDFGHQFALLVAEVAEHLKKTRPELGQPPLFVLPVDDLDLNPTECVPLLEGLRAVHSPHLFVLLLADLRLIQTVLRLQYQARFIRTGGSGTLDRETQGHVVDLAANAARKHLPPSQRTHLARVAPEEAARFSYLGEDRVADLYAIFGDVRLSTDAVWLPHKDEVTGEAPPRTIRQAKPLWLPEPTPGEKPDTASPAPGWPYSWVEVFRMSFREVLDTVLEAEIDAKRDEEGDAVLDANGNIELTEEAQRRHMTRLVQERLDTVVPMTEFGVEAHSDVSIWFTAGPRLRWRTDVLPEAEGYQVQSAGLEGWSAHWAGTSLDRAEQRELAGILDIEGADADLPFGATTSRSCPALRRTLPPGDDRPVDWPMPGHSTCWGYEDAARLLDAADSAWANMPDRWFGAWVDAMTQVIEQALRVERPTPTETEPGWPSLCDRLRHLGKEPLGRGWRVEVLALCVPEMGMLHPTAMRAVEPAGEEQAEVERLRKERSRNRSARFRKLAARPLFP